MKKTARRKKFTAEEYKKKLAQILNPIAIKIMQITRVTSPELSII